MAGSGVIDVLVVGAGPCGLAVTVAATRTGLTTLAFDRGPLVNGLTSYPTYMTFFSTAERLSIGDVPFVVATDKPTRRDALAYYRAVASKFNIEVRQYETVEALTRGTHGEGNEAVWNVQSRRRSGVLHFTTAYNVVIATGYFGRPNRLGVPGEDLPHVAHRYAEGHGAWHEPVVVVGGANSAVDAALDLWRAGAQVTMVHFADELDKNVKPWVRPDILSRLEEGSIQARFGARVVAIEPEAVIIRDATGEARIPATQVYTMTGYLAETGLLEAAGVVLDPPTGIPTHDPSTMATPVPGLYLAGVIASGFDANKIFIENGRDHGTMIVADIIAKRHQSFTTQPSPS